MIIENNPSMIMHAWSTFGKLGPNELYSQTVEQMVAATIEKLKINCNIFGFITVRKGLGFAN